MKKKHLGKEQLLALETSKKQQLDNFDKQVELMKVLRDIIWPYIKEHCKTIHEAKTFQDILSNWIINSFYEKKTQINISEIEKDKYLGLSEKGLVDKIDLSVQDMETAISTLGNLIDTYVKGEMKDKKMNDVDDKTMFFYDEKEIEKKRELLISQVEAQFK